jgi:addiction module HigA family antidote
MAMKNPPHPGLTVRRDCLEPLGLTVTAGAKVLGVTRQALNNLVNGKSGISSEMAVRLAKAFGSSAETWLGIQMDYDLAQVRRREKEISVRRVMRSAHPASQHV